MSTSGEYEIGRTAPPGAPLAAPATGDDEGDGATGDPSPLSPQPATNPIDSTNANATNTTVFESFIVPHCPS